MSQNIAELFAWNIQHPAFAALAHEVNISHDDDDYVVREDENENESRKSSKIISMEWVANAAESNLCCSFVSFFLWSHEVDDDDDHGGKTR